MLTEVRQPCPFPRISICPCTRDRTLARWRIEVVHEALSWLGTPYHHAAGIKHAGVDCAFFLIRVYEASGLVSGVDPRPYPQDWHLHRDEERYLGWVKCYCQPTNKALPGDIALYRFGRAVSHGAVVIDWPILCHSVIRHGVILSDGSQPEWATRFAGFWRLDLA